MRRKLIEQVIEKACFIGKITGSATSAVMSNVIDRDGYLSARVVVQTVATAGDTAVITINVYDAAESTGTYTVYDSANATVTINATSSVTADGFDVDLAGADRYIKVYATPESAVCTTTYTAVCILGDAVNEPCV
jgi:hypothetical protein